MESGLCRRRTREEGGGWDQVGGRGGVRRTGGGFCLFVLGAFWFFSFIFLVEVLKV